jgi:hypothetical protein
MAQKARWRPSFMDVFARTCRKNSVGILDNVTRNNALFEQIRFGAKLWREARGIREIEE